MTRRPYYFFSKCIVVFFYLFLHACSSDSVHEGLKAQKKFRTHSIAGRLMNAAIGMEGVKVFLVAQDQSAMESVSDSSGTYRFNNVIPGSYLLRPEKEGLKFSPATREIEIVEKDLESIDFSCRDLFQNEMQKSGPGDEYLSPGMEFGNSVAIEGDYILAGARKDGPGSAYIFQKTGENSWQQTARLSVDASRAGR